MENLLNLTKALEKKEIWKEYLTINENEELKKALKDDNSLNEFMNQTAISGLNLNKESKIKYTAMQHTYQMISEQLLSKIYKDIPKCTFEIEKKTNNKNSNIFNIKSNNNDDDDYDIDKNENENDNIINYDIKNKIEENNNFQKENENKIILDDMYYSLEYEINAEAEYNKKKLDKKDKIKDKSSLLEETNHYLDLPNAQYLSLYLDRHLSSQASYEVKSLIADLKPISRSKWFNEDRIGQDVLYDNFERILNELKNYVEHSGPFLNKVNKRDAPNYYEIIKKPMDLSLMSRKLKSLQYISKEEFASDLELIWSNCLAYNTNPKSPYRTHAVRMRAKANTLMKAVPNITIKIRTENDTDSEEEMTSHSIKEENSQLNQNYNTKTTNSMEKIQKQDIEQKFNDENLKKTSEVVDTEKEKNEENENIETDIKISKWKDETLELRANTFVEMEEESKKKFSDRKCITRSSTDMLEFYQKEKNWIKRIKNRYNENDDDNNNKAFNIIDNKDKKEKTKNFDDSDFYPEYSFLTSSLPQISQSLIDVGTKIIPSDELDEYILEKSPLMHEYDCMRQEKEGNSLPSIICRNIIELRTIQTLFYKIQSKQAGNEIPPSTNVPTLFESVKKQFIPESLPPLIINEDVGRTLIRRYIAQIFAHTGFDTTQNEALEIAIDVVIQFIHNLGHTLRFYVDKYSNTMDSLSILQKALSENQCNSKSLYNYMKNDIEKYGTKLVDLRKKLEYTYSDLCSPQTNQDMFDEAGFLDEDDAFISGNFGEDLGIDLFGFKQMGIDIENIPTELWKRKSDRPIRSRIRQIRRVDPNNTIGNQTNSYSIAPKFDPITDIKTQVIGLLQPYYEKKKNDNDILDDEFKTVRARSKMLRNRIAMRKKRDEEEHKRRKERTQLIRELKEKEKNQKDDKVKKTNKGKDQEIIMASGTTIKNAQDQSSAIPKESLKATDLSTKEPNTILSKNISEVQKEKKRKRDEKLPTTTKELKKVKSEK